jgi:subtilisin family serine protease
MLLVLICGCFVPGPANARKLPTELPEGACEQGRLIVAPQAGLPKEELQKILREHGLGNAQKIGQSDMYILDLPGRGSEKSVLARLQHNPKLKFVEADCLVPSEWLPNDGGYSYAWHLPKVGAPDAWDVSQGAGITIAILDSGVDGAHPDLAANIVPGWNFYDNNSNTADVYGHGTKVAGAAAAITNNVIGVSGIAGQAKIMPMRVTNTSGSGYYSMMAQALVWAADRGALVASLSFAGVAGSTTIFNAANYFKSKGGLVTVSAGNYSVDHGYPASDALIVVSSTDQNDNRASWSSYGAAVDFAAPGVNILTTVAGGTYTGAHGTSFSSPVTAGVIALMKSVNPTLPNTEIEGRLCSSAVDIGAMGKDIYFGCGRINAAAAVESVRLAIPTPDLQAPLVDISSPYEDATVSGLVPVNVAATDNVGVARVELKVNNNPVAIDTSSPFGFTWDSKGISNGPAALIAYATDAAGNIAASDPVTVNVANVVPVPVKDTTPPAIKIVTPVAGSVSGNVTVTINIADDNGAAGVRTFAYIDGMAKASGTGSTLSFNWQTKNEVAGSHMIMVMSRDAAGNAASAVVSVTVAK